MAQLRYNPELNAYHGVLQEFHQSLYDLGVGFVDLLLIHWPGLAVLPEDRVPKEPSTPRASVGPKPEQPSLQDELPPTPSRELMRAKRKESPWPSDSKRLLKLEAFKP